MARHYWPNGGALGQSLRIPDDGVGQTVKPAIYIPYTLDMEVYTVILIHSNGSLTSVYRAVREQVRSVDADQPIEGHGEIVSLEAMVTRQKEWQQAQLATILLGAFGLLGLALASVGLYSVVSYGVAQRTNEFGIRIALGAQQRHVLRLVFTSAAASIGSGLAAGVLLSFYATKLVAHWTEVSASNPFVLLNATLLLLAAATVASLLPARRATSINPMEALRRQ
jgi:putative ABC transport system permease protein